MNLRTFVTNLLTAVPLSRRGYVSLMSEPRNASSSATVASLQSALRAAEAGDTRNLFALYRDLTCGGSHVQAECNKRKLALLAQPFAILPADKANPEDLIAADACNQMIRDCENWSDALTHLLDSHAIWPVTVVEKLFRPRNLPGETPTRVPLRYTLRRLEPVNPTLLCFREPLGVEKPAPGTPAPTVSNWEVGLRFFNTDERGTVKWNYYDTYPAEPARHIVHRGHLLVGHRDCYGGPGRAILFWWLLATLGRDWFARAMERFGVPFPVGHTNAQDKQAIDFLSEAFALSTKIGGLVVDHDTQIELKEVAVSGLADAHEKFIGICNREISKVIVGQTMSSEAQASGLGSGNAKLHGDVREDIRMFDQMRLGETLTKQLFAPFLQINGLRGAPPKIVWGGLSEEDANTLASLLLTLSNAGWEPTAEAVPTLSERLGFPLQKKAVTAPAPQFGFGSLTGPTGPTSPTTFSAQAATANALGVPASWLNPVREFLTTLEAKAADQSLSDADLKLFLNRAVERVPELFAKMNVDDLAKVLEAGMGSAVVDAARKNLRK